MAERRKSTKKVAENWKRPKLPAENWKRELWRKPEKAIFKSRKAGKLKNICGNRKTLFKSCGNRKIPFKRCGKPEKPKKTLRSRGNWKIRKKKLRKAGKIDIFPRKAGKQPLLQALYISCWSDGCSFILTSHQYHSLPRQLSRVYNRSRLCVCVCVFHDSQWEARKSVWPSANVKTWSHSVVCMKEQPVALSS